MNIEKVGKIDLSACGHAQAGLIKKGLRRKLTEVELYVKLDLRK